jgi:homoserine O-acetyltransferase/O-succinyltransferase
MILAVSRSNACRILTAVVWLCAACVGEKAYSQPPQSPPGDGAQQITTLGDFRLQSGVVVHDFRIGYRTLGKLNADKSNAILWPTWLGGRSEELLQFIGPGNVVDSSKYFVILVDSIGNGISTSPSNSSSQPRMKFPKFTIRDMVESGHRLLTEVLRLGHLHAVMGLSMGGMQAFEWAVAYPDLMDLTIPMAGSPQSTSYDKLLWTSEIDAIELDPAWNNGNPKGPLTRGIALAEEIDSLNLTSPAYRAAHTQTDDFESFLAEIRKGASAEPGAVIDQIRQRQAIMSQDIPREYGVPLEQAARRVRSKMLVIVSPQDHMVNPSPAAEFAKAIGAPVVTLDSPCGHRSLSCVSVGPIVAQFLASPSSVRSETLRDPSNR